MTYLYSEETVKATCPAVYYCSGRRGTLFSFPLPSTLLNTICQYLIEIKKAELREVPIDWHVVSATQTLRRLRTPKMVTLLQRRAEALEALTLAANAAYRGLLAEIAEHHYAVLRDAIQRLAVFDCLCSLARVGVQEGYVRPEFIDSIDGEDTLVVEDGRHPMIEKLRDDPFVPNSVDMGGRRHKIVTGPNMGGKSSVVRMVALCAIMAQIGSYVPAMSMRLSMLDGILIRMGGVYQIVESVPVR